MNCTGFEKLVIEMARGGLTEAAARCEAAAHANTCARCARRLANEQRLSGVVAAIVEQDSQGIAPAAVEQMLLAEFKKQHAASKRGGTWRARAVVGAVAAALIVAVAIGLRRTPEQHTVQMKPPEAHATPPEVPVVAPAGRDVSKPHVRTLRAARRKTSRRPTTEALAPHQVAQREVMTEFIPIVYDPEPIERGQIVRIRLPRSALATFGIPMNEERAEEAIRADVLLGEDGLARAVRFVK